MVGGKEWVGPAFLAAPKVLLFKDFNVGQAYDLKFTLTNVSYSFNMFRQVPLPEQVRSFFELTHVPPGNPPYLPISPHISPYLPLSPHISFFELTHEPPGNPPCLPISPHISPYLLFRADARAAR